MEDFELEHAIAASEHAKPSPCETSNSVVNSQSPEKPLSSVVDGLGIHTRYLQGRALESASMWFRSL